ncbi:MAG TPA: hypothetical protein DCX06_00625 [Opitutae bacterium]|nr:hypothetical protein [Opitutae bacterium]
MSSTTSVYDTARPKHAKALDHLNDLNDPETALEGDSAAMTEAVETLSAFFEGAEMTLSEAINQVDRLSADEARNFLVEAFALPSADPRRSRLINNLLEQLAKSHPQEAYDLTRSIGSLRDAERAKVAILEVWANRDPVAALAWSKTALADEPRHLYSSQMRALFRGYAEMNPQAALTAAQALPVGSKEEIRMRTQLMGEVIETQVREGQIQQATLAIEWIDDPDVRQSMNLELVDEWARFDPTGAATYVESLSEEATTRIKISLVDEWAESDPAAAAAWLSGLDAEDPAVARAASDLIREWTRYDLTASAEWLNSLPASPELDRAVANYTFRAAQEDPANAMSWAESVSNDRMRNRLMESVAGSWKSEDPAAFEQYLESAELTAEQKEQLLNAENRGYGGGRSPFGRR